MLLRTVTNRTCLAICAICALLLATLACAFEIPSPTPTRIPTATLRRPLTPTAEPGDTGWQSQGNGIELRRLAIEMNGLSNRLWLARVDPAKVNFRVLYDRSNPRPVSEWFASAKPLLVVNAGFFTEDYYATGLIIADGKRSGQSYAGFGGMLAVRADKVEVRWLVAKPYNPTEPLRQAVQAFPMLVHSGGKPGISEDDGQIARRTVVGQDRKGRIVFVLSPDAFFTLKALASFLAASDLELDVALNLDGGLSSGLLLAGREGQLGADSWIKIPAVIVVEAR